jgi:hypothetical protein
MAAHFLVSRHDNSLPRTARGTKNPFFIRNYAILALVKTLTDGPVFEQAGAEKFMQLCANPGF